MFSFHSSLTRLQRQQKEEERAAKEAQRLAEEKRVQEERERKQEADRKRREEERRVKEEEKRLREEERIKKEEERKRKAKEDKAREAEKERKRKEEQLAMEKEEQLAKEKEEQLAKEREDQLFREKEEQAKRAEEDARRQEREAYLKQQLALEQLRQEELRLQEQLAKQELALELELQQEEERQREALATTVAATTTDTLAVQDTVPQSPSLKSSSPTSGLINAIDEAQSRSPKVSPSPLPCGVGETLNDQPALAQGLSTSAHTPLWSNSYPAQSNPQAHVQSQHSLAHQHSMFQQPVQHGLFRPPTHFGHIGGEHDAFSSRIGHSAGRGGFLAGPSHPNHSPFQVAPQHSSSSSQVPPSMGGLRSPGLGPIGYGPNNTSTKQMMTLMNTNSSAAHDLPNKSGSPLHSPSSLGAIGTPINSFGPISPIGHARRTSTPHGPTTDAIKPIQRPVPIGRPKDSAHASAGAISSSFDGLTLGLSGLAVGAEIERRSRSPPLNLTGGSALDLDGVVLGNKDTLRSTNGGSESHSFSNDAIASTGLRQLDPSEPLQSLSPSNPGSFFTNSFFGSRMNGHGKTRYPDKPCPHIISQPRS